MKPLTYQNQAKIEDFYMQEGRWLDTVIRGEFPVVTRFIEKRLKGRIANAASWLLLNIAGFAIARKRHMDIPDLKRAGKFQIVKSITTVVTRKGREVAKKDFPVGVILKA